MPARKEQITRVTLPDGVILNVRILDGITIDDLLVQGAKAEGYRVITDQDNFPTVDRKVIDYLLRLGVISG